MTRSRSRSRWARRCAAAALLAAFLPLTTVGCFGKFHDDGPEDRFHSLPTAEGAQLTSDASNERCRPPQSGKIVTQV